MRSGRQGRIAAWLGLLALAVNALVPVHLAFDLAEAVAASPTRYAHAEARDAEWRVLALLSGHLETGGKPHGHGTSHHASCPVCTALGTLAGFAPAQSVALPLPAPAALPSPLPAAGGEPVGSPAAYRSRAPPVA